MTESFSGRSPVSLSLCLSLSLSLSLSDGEFDDIASK